MRESVGDSTLADARRDKMSAAVKAKAAIFDLDGTLANTFQLVFDAFNEAMRAPLGRHYTPEEIIARFGIPDSAMIRRELPRERWAEAVSVYHAFYEKAHDMVKPFPGVPELLTELRCRKTPMAIVTGKGRRTMQTTLRLMKWHRLFRVAVCGEDVAKQKPAPDGALAAASKLGVEPKDCAFIGDSPSDVRAGKAAGMISVAACWHPVYLSDIKRLEPDVCAMKPADVLKLFE
jgi:HAD superfamily hydrolase (TIGR01509 family)